MFCDLYPKYSEIRKFRHYLRNELSDETCCPLLQVPKNSACDRKLITFSHVHVTELLHRQNCLLFYCNFLSKNCSALRMLTGRSFQRDARFAFLSCLVFYRFHLEKQTKYVLFKT